MVIHIRLHIEVTVAAQIEEDRLADARFLAAQRLVDHGLNRVVRLRGGQNALGSGELDAGGKTAELRFGSRLELIQR